jgi:hypothetical protein
MTPTRLRPSNTAPSGGTAVVLVFSLAMLLAVGTAAWVDSDEGVTLPVAVILAYAVVGYALERRQADAVAALADQVYFLSYLGTLAAIGVLAVMLSRDAEGLKDTRTIARLAGVAVWGSVAGVVMLKTLKARSRALPGGGASSGGPPAGESSLVDGPERQVVSGALAELERASAAMSALREASGAAEAEVARLRGQVAALGQAVNQLGGAAQEGSRDFAALRQEVRQVRQVLDEFARLVQARLDEGVWQ